MALVGHVPEPELELDIGKGTESIDTDFTGIPAEGREDRLFTSVSDDAASGTEPSGTSAGDDSGGADGDTPELPTLEVARAEIRGSRPVVGSEVSLQVWLRTSGGRVFEDRVSNPNLRYRWTRGPVVRSCVFHPQRSAKWEDSLKTFQHYCSKECFLRGWYVLPKELWNLEPSTTKKKQKQETSEWVEISNSRKYSPSAQDVDCPLRLEIVPIMPDGSDAPIGRTEVTTDPVMPVPKETRTRRMKCNGGQFNAEWHSKQIKVMDWNILADLYATESQYPYCEPWALAWPWRKQLIMKEITSMSTDIVTLQEVQKDAFDDWFRPEFARAGYEGVFQQKRREVFHKGTYVAEGCATFYKTSRFKRVEKMVFDFDKISYSELCSSPQAVNGLQRASKGNIALALVLEDQVLQPTEPWQAVGPNGGHKLCVVNTHIFADVDSEDIKLWQAYLLVQSIHQHGLEQMPLLVCGDFNSIPTSAVYKYLCEGALDSEIKLPRDPSGLLEFFKVGHSLRLSTAYRECCGNEAAFTNYTVDFKGALDYIFFSSDRLQALTISEIDDDRVLAEETALPCSTRPSDHVSLIATFMFRDDPPAHLAQHMSAEQQSLLAAFASAGHHQMGLAAGAAAPQATVAEASALFSRYYEPFASLSARQPYTTNWV